MNKFLLIAAILIANLSFAQHNHSHTPMETEVDSVSYAVGMNIASSLKQGGIDSLNYEIFMQAIKDVMVQNHVIMDGNAANQIVNNYIKKKKEAESASAIEDGKKFLAANSSKPGVNVTPSGLQYKIIKAGNGAKPVDGNKVKTHYRGTLISGKQFDSSYDRGQPATFGVNQVIKGWTEALKMMPVGSKWELTIPQELAYGPRGGPGGSIPPYSVLVFEIELLEIVE